MPCSTLTLCCRCARSLAGGLAYYYLTQGKKGKSAKVAILDAGAQYGKLIDRRVRELHVESDMLPLNTPPEKLTGYGYRPLPAPPLATDVVRMVRGPADPQSVSQRHYHQWRARLVL